MQTEIGPDSTAGRVNAKMDAPNASIPRYNVELPGPALQPGPAAHNLEIAPIGVHTHDPAWQPDKQ